MSRVIKIPRGQALRLEIQSPEKTIVSGGQTVNVYQGKSPDLVLNFRGSKYCKQDGNNFIFSNTLKELDDSPKEATVKITTRYVYYRSEDDLRRFDAGEAVRDALKEFIEGLDEETT